MLLDDNGIKQKIRNRKIREKSLNTWCLKNTFLNTTWVKLEISREIWRYFELNEHENITYQNLWDIAKAVNRGKFIALNAYIIKEQRPKVNNLSFHFMKLEKEEKTKSK